jgi:hypothetical protein
MPFLQGLAWWNQASVWAPPPPWCITLQHSCVWSCAHFPSCIHHFPASCTYLYCGFQLDAHTHSFMQYVCAFMYLASNIATPTITCGLTMLA